MIVNINCLILLENSKRHQLRVGDEGGLSSTLSNSVGSCSWFQYSNLTGWTNVIGMCAVKVCVIWNITAMIACPQPPFTHAERKGIQ